jgi:hypothetical protein
MISNAVFRSLNDTVRAPGGLIAKERIAGMDVGFEESAEKILAERYAASNARPRHCARDRGQGRPGERGDRREGRTGAPMVVAF